MHPLRHWCERNSKPRRQFRWAAARLDHSGRKTAFRSRSQIVGTRDLSLLPPTAISLTRCAVSGPSFTPRRTTGSEPIGIGKGRGRLNRRHIPRELPGLTLFPPGAAQSRLSGDASSRTVIPGRCFLCALDSPAGTRQILHQRAVTRPGNNARPADAPSRDSLGCPVSTAAHATSLVGDVWYRRIRFSGLIHGGDPPDPRTLQV